MCPGKRGVDISISEAVKSGNVELVLCLFENSEHKSYEEAKTIIANQAAFHGDRSFVQSLRSHGFHCSSAGADLAAWNGHLDVLHDLQIHGIYCTNNGANWAAERGHVEVWALLKSQGILCTDYEAMMNMYRMIPT